MSDKTGEPQAKRSRTFEEGHEAVFNLSSLRRVTVRDFRGKTLIDIREYYANDAGEMKPGKKGISLTEEQWRKLVDTVVPKVDALLRPDDAPAPAAPADEKSEP